MNYRVTQKNGKWSIIDSAGKDFFSLGVDCVTPVDVDFRNATDVYKSEPGWFPKWADGLLSTIAELKFNTLGSWHHLHYWGNGFPKTVELSLSRLAEKANTVWGTGFPDVFDSSFEVSIDKTLVDCIYGKGAALLQDEGMIGWFTDNELHWWGSGGYWGDDDQGRSADSTGLVDDYIGLAADAAGKQAWVAFLVERHGTIDSLNRAWGSEYTMFDELLQMQHYRANADVLQADKTEFLRRIAHKYFEATSRILKQYDPNHLNLGCRFVGNSTPDVVLEVMKDYVDVNSMNFYAMEFPETYLNHVYELTGKPVMITEFSFCAGATAGFVQNTNGARNVLVKDQKRRGECYREFIHTARNTPYMVGTHWFAMFDYGMNIHGLVGNYGLMDMDCKPWVEFGELVKQAHEGIVG
jgi:hypothetical protein